MKSYTTVHLGKWGKEAVYSKFHILNYSFSSYWAVFTVGLLLMAVINTLRRKMMGFSRVRAVLSTMLICFLSLAGAKLLFALENWRQFLDNGITLDGVSFFGAVFFLPSAMYLICKWRKIPYGDFMDYCAPSLMTMLAVLRIGCRLNGCCGGITIQEGAYAGTLIPVQIMECMGDLVILGVLFLVEWHDSGKGMLYPCILLLYGVMRFVLEFFRDTPKDWLYLSHGQWFSIVSAIAGVCFLRRIMKNIPAESSRKKKNYKRRKRRL